MNTKLRQVAMLLLVVCFAVVVGCKTDQPGVTNTAGTIKATLASTPDAVTEASKKVLEDMDLAIISSGSTAIDGKVEARTAQDVKVKITCDTAGDNVTDIAIRVGTLGDKELSLAILDAIKEELGVK